MRGAPISLRRRRKPCAISSLIPPGASAPLRHGGGQARVDIENVQIAAQADDDELLAVHEVLDKLAAEEPQKAELTKLRYFVGMTFEEAAEVAGHLRGHRQAPLGLRARLALRGNSGQQDPINA